MLRGPFSSLYGNSSGGVISVFTADGGPGKVLEAGTAFGSDGVRRQNVGFSGAEGAWNWNLGAAHFETDGYRDHSAAKRDGFNGKVRLDATRDTQGHLRRQLGVDMPDVQDPLGLTRAEYEANPRAATPVALHFNTRKSVDQLQAGAILDHRIDDVHALKLTTWAGSAAPSSSSRSRRLVQAPRHQPGRRDRRWTATTAAWTRSGSRARGWAATR